MALSEIKEPSRARRISILGATGSIGNSTADLIRRNRDRFDVVAVTAHRNAEALAALAREFDAELAVVADPDAYPALRDALVGTGTEAAGGH
ncbi:MAG: 1-deoxy-D-xylulose-5-phosphate reductoisomerase, partial [Rhodospirillaceae bacterium]